MAQGSSKKSPTCGKSIVEARLAMKFKNFLYVVSSSTPSPTGRGTAVEHLKHYKLSSEDEVFIPWTDASVPLQGDLLWMQVDNKVIAYVEIGRVVEDVMNGRLELWFDGKNINNTKEGGISSDWLKGSAPISDERAARWIDQLHIVDSRNLPLL